MDVAAISSSMSQMKIRQQANIQLASKVMDISKQNGNNLIKMMEASKLEHSVNPSVGKNIDIRL